MNSENKKQHEPVSNQQIVMLILGMLALGAYSQRAIILAWIFDNMTYLILGAIGLFSLIGFFLYRKITKKDNVELKRMQSLTQARAQSKRPEQYYRPKGRK